MKIAIVSLYGNPLGSHHLDYINGAAQIGAVYAIVNNDQQVELKGSYKFLDENTRLRIIRSLKNVMYAKLSIDTDSSIIETLKTILYNARKDSQFVFCNGGDRVPGECSSKEEEFCRLNNIELAYNIGGGKTGSSSEILQTFLNKYWIKADPRLAEWNINYESPFSLLTPFNKIC